MISFDDKQRVLKSGLHLLQKKVSRNIYKGQLTLHTIEVNNLNETDYFFWLKVQRQFEQIYGEDYKIATKLNHNEYKRVKRLKAKMLEAVLSNQALFLTLTFSDDTIAETSSLTRRRYVARYLKSQSAFYIANVDFGGEKGREHYHAVLVGRSIDYALWRKYGAIKGLKVRPTKNDNTKISKYVAKLSNHAIKETAHQVRLIYSR